jgi:hypothetical protein
LIRRFFFAAVFGTLMAFLAMKLGLSKAPVQAIATAMFSALGFFMSSMMLRGRLRRRQGEAPRLLEGEKALLFGPGEVADSQGSAKAWIYLSNLRLMLREEGGGAVDLKLEEIEELRPAKEKLFGGELALVAKGRGLIRLKVPDVSRWQKAMQEALRS